MHSSSQHTTNAEFKNFVLKIEVPSYFLHGKVIFLESPMFFSLFFPILKHWYIVWDDISCGDIKTKGAGSLSSESWCF